MALPSYVNTHKPQYPVIVLELGIPAIDLGFDGVTYSARLSSIPKTNRDAKLMLSKSTAGEQKRASDRLFKSLV